VTTSSKKPLHGSHLPTNGRPPSEEGRLHTTQDPGSQCGKEETKKKFKDKNTRIARKKRAKGPCHLGLKLPLDSSPTHRGGVRHVSRNWLTWGDGRPSNRRKARATLLEPDRVPGTSNDSKRWVDGYGTAVPAGRKHEGDAEKRGGVGENH